MLWYIAGFVAGVTVAVIADNVSSSSTSSSSVYSFAR
jgi:hypothetical protein